MPVSPLVARYDHLLLDLDGTVWVGDDATPRAVEAVAALRDAGKTVTFVTNDARLGGEEFVRKLWRLGFRVALEEVVTVGGAVQHLLNERFAGRSAFVIGSPAMHRHVGDAGLRIVNGTTFASRAEVVVVAGHEAFDYDELRTATQAVLRGAALVGAGRDRTFPMPDGPWPATGALLAAVETATQVEAETVGKPQPGLFRTALDRLSDPGEATALMVGDRLDADIGGAIAAGLDAALVLSGATTEEEAAEHERSEARIPPPSPAGGEATGDDHEPTERAEERRAKLVTVAQDLATLVLS